MKNRIYIACIAVFTVLAVAASYFYASSGKAWLLCVSCCAVFILLACVAALAYGARGKRGREQSKIYSKKERYLSRPEAEFLSVLRGIVGGRYEVYAQVPLVSVIDKNGSAFRNELFRVVDYLIADPANSTPLLLIELNDASHARRDRVERDRKVAEICACAGIPLIAFTFEQAKNVPEVKKTVMKMLK